MGTKDVACSLFALLVGTFPGRIGFGLDLRPPASAAVLGRWFAKAQAMESWDYGNTNTFTPLPLLVFCFWSRSKLVCDQIVWPPCHLCDYCPMCLFVCKLPLATLAWFWGPGEPGIPSPPHVVAHGSLGSWPGQLQTSLWTRLRSFIQGTVRNVPFCGC